MVKEWDNDGAFEDLANIEIDESDLEERDPFDISRALEGAALEHLNPEGKAFGASFENSNLLATSLKQLKN